MDRITPLILILIVGPLGGCIFTVDTELRQAPDDAGIPHDTDTGPAETDDPDANTDHPPPSVTIVDAPATKVVHQGADPLVEYEIECAPQGCEDDLRCRLQVGDTDWGDWWDCQTTVALGGDQIGEGGHHFQVALQGEFDEPIGDSHQMVILFEFSLTVDLDGNDEPIPYYYPRPIDLECSRPDCAVQCHWEDANGQPLGSADCDEQILTLALPEGQPQADLIIEACAAIDLPDDLVHCLPPKRYTFSKADPAWLTISAGARHNCAVFTDHSLWCWGRNNAGQLGLGDGGADHGLAARVDLDDVVAISAGHDHSCAIDDEGRLFCWGDNTHGQLGFTPDDSTRPQEVDDLAHLSPWQTVSAGARHTCAINHQGHLFCWGLNDRGQSGNGDAETHGLIDLPDGDFISWLAISASVGHSCGIAERDDGTGAAYCWGDQGAGRLGNNEDTAFVDIPQEVRGDLDSWNTEAIAAGDEHTCAIATSTSNRRAYCWGQGDEGRLGTAEDKSWPTPQRVTRSSELLDDYGPNDFDDYLGIATGSEHSCGLHIDGTAFCWGENIRGQLGTGGAPITTPSAVAAAAGQSFTQIAAGDEHSCAIDHQDQINCWGRPDHGRLGLGTDDGEYLGANTPAPIKWPF